ncbi:LacI family DNA-binding transcriptional regulator, partial [Micromonospora sp. NPDC005313]
MVFPQRVKMSDVARTAGVSVATVSKVVNGRYGVAQATVERVQEVIRELGYEASLGAQSLRSHRTNVLGILVAEFEPFSTELLKGASREVAGSGYQLLAYSSGDGEGAAIGWERRSLARLSGTLIDGAVIVTPTVVETKHGFHVVAVDPHTGPSGLPTVDSDNFAGAVLATDHLLSLGHRRIAHISGRPDLES